MSAEIRMSFEGPFIVENQEIAYEIAATKKVSDIVAIAIMTGGDDILSLEGNNCSCLYSYSKQKKPSYVIDMDNDLIEIRITNNIADERTFKTIEDFKKWVYGYLTYYGWKISEVNEGDVEIEFINKYTYERGENGN